MLVVGEAFKNISRPSPKVERERACSIALGLIRGYLDFCVRGAPIGESRYTLVEVGSAVFAVAAIGVPQQT